MDYCLALAARGAGQVSPNPLVGAAVVRDHCVVSAGWHERYGGPHAEVNALRNGFPADATLYVTLEPCCHHGKTPPCTDLLLRRGVRRAVIGMRDPHAKVAGKGLAQLRRAGVQLTVGVRERDCRALNRSFCTHITTGRPFVILKAGLTLDGAIAPANGRRTVITSAAARADAARFRATVDAIIVGRGTAAADNPRLTVRGVRGARAPWRIVMDTCGSLSPRLRLFTDGAAPTLWVTGPAAQLPPSPHYEQLRLPLDRAGHPDLQALLAELGRRGRGQVMVEGGGTLNAAFLRTGLVDACRLYLAPRALGGKRVPWLAESAPGIVWREWSLTRHNDYALFTGWRERA